MTTIHLADDAGLNLLEIGRFLAGDGSSGTLEFMRNGARVHRGDEIFEGIGTVTDGLLETYLKTVVDQRWRNSRLEHRGHVWIDDETPIGQVEGREWASRSERNLHLYADVLETMDLNHECTQIEDVLFLARKWRGRKEILIPIAAYITMPNQFAGESLEELLTESGFVANFDDWHADFAQRLVNRYSIVTCTREMAPGFPGAPWDVLSLEGLEDVLDGAQLETLELAFRKHLVHRVGRSEFDFRDLGRMPGLSHHL